MNEYKTIKLEGRVFVTFNLKAVTGLHIGGSDAGIEIGGVDKTVVRDVLTNQPYIPGSSLKGKVRSLLEKYQGLLQNRKIGQAFIHSCRDAAEYADCAVCRIFGVPGEENFSTPTRLVVRDVHLHPDSAKQLEDSARTDLPYTEVKTEVAIDRVTSRANPRQMERVPAGTVFGPAELVYSVYGGDVGDPQQDVAHLKTLIAGLQLLEDDYLGGLGSRGSGKVALAEIKVTVRKGTLDQAQPAGAATYATLAELAADWEHVLDEVRDALKLA
ncbi:MAG TPA: type III-A CRISPR-associated RAMP protein Csm3 [Chloroflexi bacterium]|nr:type III-A CRISPR-associated RAMP protein Csm3 [Chloroflexota bacterium]